MPNWPCTEQLHAARCGPFSQILSHIGKLFCTVKGYDTSLWTRHVCSIAHLEYGVCACLCTANPHLIQQQYLWVEEEGPRYGNTLFLASRQPDSPLSHHRVVATLRKVEAEQSSGTRWKASVSEFSMVCTYSTSMHMYIIYRVSYKQGMELGAQFY